MDYKEFTAKANKGEILIGIDPATARKFFMSMSKGPLEMETGESLFIEYFVVNSCFIAFYTILLSNVILSIFIFHYYSIIVIPVIILTALAYQSKASMGNQNMIGVFLFLVLCFFFAYDFREKGPIFISWLILLPLPFLFIRTMYKMATTFLRGLAIMNEKIFNLLNETNVIVIREVNSKGG